MGATTTQTTTTGTTTETTAPAKPATRHLSHSQVETYTQCPRRWQADKMWGIKGAPSEALILGNALHATLEEDGERRRMRQTPYTLEQLTTRFRQALRAEMARQDPENTLQMVFPIMETRGEVMVEAYANDIAPQYSPMLVEHPFSVPIPGAARDKDGLPWTFDGRIDARTFINDEHGRPVLWTFDWKTASKPWREGDEHGKDQATAYYFAHIMELLQQVRGKYAPEEVDDPFTLALDAATVLPKAASRTAFIVFASVPESLPGKTFTCTADVRSTQRSAAQVQEYARRLRRVVREINDLEQTGAEAPVKPSALCGWCAYCEHCAAGQAYLISKGKPLPFAQTPTLRVPTPEPELADVVETPAADVTTDVTDVATVAVQPPVKKAIRRKAS